jgi:transposase-like protein
MDCSTCKVECRPFGRHRNGLRRFRCGDCKKTYTEPHRPRVETNPLAVMRIPQEKAVLALQLLVEASSVRTTERITGLHRDTILRLLVHAGQKCVALMGRLIVNIPVKQVRVDYAMLIKHYAEDAKAEKRYSPAERIGCKKHAVIGDPDPAMISISHIERSNLTMRTQIKRLARLTLSFSKKWDNLRLQSLSTSPTTISAACTGRCA